VSIRQKKSNPEDPGVAYSGILDLESIRFTLIFIFILYIVKERPPKEETAPLHEEGGECGDARKPIP